MRRKSRVLKKTLIMFLFVVLIISMYGCSKESAKLNLSIFNKEKTELFNSDDGNYMIAASNKWKKIEVDKSQNILLALKNEEYSSNYLLSEEKKSEYSSEMNLETYSKMVGESASKYIENATISESEDIIINNMEGKKFLVSGEKDGVKLSYIFTVLDSEDSYLKQIIWSSEKNITDNENDDYYNTILSSLNKSIETP